MNKTQEIIEELNCDENLTEKKLLAASTEMYEIWLNGKEAIQKALDLKLVTTKFANQRSMEVTEDYISGLGMCTFLRLHALS